MSCHRLSESHQQQKNLKSELGGAFQAIRNYFLAGPNSKVNLDIFRSIMQNENNLAMDLLTKTYTQHIFFFQRQESFDLFKDTK